MSANSKVGVGIWPKFYLIQALMLIHITCKNAENRFISGGTRVVTTRLSLYVYWDFSDAQGQLAPQSELISSQLLNLVKILWFSLLPEKMEKIRQK